MEQWAETLIAKLPRKDWHEVDMVVKDEHPISLDSTLVDGSSIKITVCVYTDDYNFRRIPGATYYMSARANTDGSLADLVAGFHCSMLSSMVEQKSIIESLKTLERMKTMTPAQIAADVLDSRLLSDCTMSSKDILNDPFRFATMTKRELLKCFDTATAAYLAQETAKLAIG